MIWYKDKNTDIAVSTRIRLARNIENIPFPNALSNREQLSKEIKNAIFNSNSTLSTDFLDIDYNKLSDVEKQSLNEEHLISNEMLTNGLHDVLLNKDKTMSLLIMEEDHIRLQVIKPGYCLDDSFELADKVDDVLSEHLNYAFDERLGYLTSCPTNLGTALRASVMLHLPALTLLGRIKKVIYSANSIGVEVRGFWGEGSQGIGDFYQISNRTTLGISEQDTIKSVKNVCDQIIALEKEARKQIIDENIATLTDKIYRSYGTLKYARSISSAEAIKLLSDVLLGINMDIIKEDVKFSIMECITNILPAHLSNRKIISPEERDIERSNYLRKIFN